ncbi:lysozyme [Chitinophaga agrisoli]|uniref:Lysozyme n=1 Tax=Chitinophaga agrisoli TaxID=2607653 RepID=A0A5B2VWV2_9BACT|nr:lysozyme [Chitinophaga agrisoli]KAA2242792.1 lysozyme [Chitinophaga agrisoli]
MTLSEKGAALIKEFEQCRLEAYQDKAGVWTIGWGNTFYENDKRVKQGDKVAQWRADDLFKRIVQRFVNDVNVLTKDTVLQQQQFDALVSFAYNVGSDIDLDKIAEGLGDSALLKYVLANPEDPRIPGEFLKWNKSNKKVLAGLTRRRQAEAHLYTTGELKCYF